MKTRKCPFNHELLVPYASGNLDGQNRVIVERHLAQCGHCREEVRALEEVWWTLDTWNIESQPVSKPRFSDLRRRISAEEQKQPLWNRWVGVWHSWVASIQLVPTMAVTTIVCALFMLPWLQSYLTTQSVNVSPTTIAQDSTPASTQPIAEESSRTLVAKNAEQEAFEKGFQKALAKSRQQREDDAQERSQSPRTYAPNGYTNVSFTPSADFLPPQPSQPFKQPFTSLQAMQGQRIRLGY